MGRFLVMILLVAACGSESPQSPTPPDQSDPPETPDRPDPRPEHQMTLIPAGEFTMGSGDLSSAEKPVHTVYLDSFMIDRYEVTNAQFSMYLNDIKYDARNQGLIAISPYNAEISLVSGRFKPWSVEYEERPVHDVKWVGAAAYCAWIGGRLPTEAEWEKAARGTDSRMYPWGDGEPESAVVNFDHEVGSPVVVGSYPRGASPYGVHDLAGNIHEWTFDWYSSDYYGHSPADNPSGPLVGERRVVRGGSCFDDAEDIRTYARNHELPESQGIGFRCVKPVGN